MDTLEVSLPNGSDGDALVHVRLLPEDDSILFDAGNPSALQPRDVLRLRHLFVSHCHVDHFIGFDALIRPRVCRPDHVTVHGPTGFLERVASRLGGYTWNLTDGNHCIVTAREVTKGRIRVARFDSGHGFRREDLDDEFLEGVVYQDADISVQSAALDHHVVSQGWALQRPERLHVRMDVVAELGLGPGRWLAELKRLTQEHADPGTPVATPDGKAAPLGRLQEQVLTRTRGERVAYVTDTGCTSATRPLIVALAAGADVFACGAPFLDSEAERAAHVRHLTARQAGEMAAEAGARSLLLFHVSDRYAGDFRAHVDEASSGARGQVDVRVSPPLSATS